ncbi:MAG: hypothetical protein SVJ22_09795 [Halobacteriota archaeon]|nr:hypothetical protein [Halobacteriota archaeon]
MDEAARWLKECLKVFPLLKKHDITCKYSKLPKNVLGRVKISYLEEKDIDARALLLEGRSRLRVSKKRDDKYKIEISEKFKGIEEVEVRKQVVEHTIIHELLHIEANDFDVIAENSKTNKRKKIHVKAFKEEVFRRFNELRELGKIPTIENREDLDLAINKIVNSLEETAKR